MGRCSNSQRPSSKFSRNHHETRGPVVVAAIKAIEVVAESCVYARVNAQIDIKHWIHMRSRQYAVCLNGMPKLKM